MMEVVRFLGLAAFSLDDHARAPPLREYAEAFAIKVGLESIPLSNVPTHEKAATTAAGVPPERATAMDPRVILAAL